MSAIRSKNTKPELYLRKLLFSMGYRYRLHPKNIPGKPDLWLAKYRTAVFVHGCFWHRHSGCKFATNPKANEEYWNKKFRSNVERDKKVKNEILERGLKCLVVWECTIKKMEKCEKTEQSILNQLDRLPSSVNGLSRINSASNNAILESGREAPYVQEIAVQRPDFC